MVAGILLTVAVLPSYLGVVALVLLLANCRRLTVDPELSVGADMFSGLEV